MGIVHPATALSPGATRLRRTLARPRALAILGVSVLAALGWLYLGLMVGRAARAGQGLGLGMGLIDVILTGRFDAFGAALPDLLCRPTFGQPPEHLAMPAAPAASLALVYLMWSAMTFAMMLPTAGPMVLTYAEIAETAAVRGERAASPFVFTAGYAAAWLAFALAATALQWVLARLALLNPPPGSTSQQLSGAFFIAAGAYQFSALKTHCMTFCQRPFPYLFANWRSESRAVFGLGLRQGLHCLGCCWAMMLVMFAVGVMNVVWMAALAVVMAVEKSTTTTRFSRAVGVVFIATGAALCISSIMEQWFARAG